MAPKRLGYFGELIQAGALEDGAVVRYKLKTGSLLGVGRARDAGIFVPNSLHPLSVSAFEKAAGQGLRCPGSSRRRPAAAGDCALTALQALDWTLSFAAAGSNLRRPAQNIYLNSGGTVAEAFGGRSSPSGGGDGGQASRPLPLPELPVVLQDDENDEFCYICALGVSVFLPAILRALMAGLSSANVSGWPLPNVGLMVITRARPLLAGRSHLLRDLPRHLPHRLHGAGRAA